MVGTPRGWARSKDEWDNILDSDLDENDTGTLYPASVRVRRQVREDPPRLKDENGQRSWSSGQFDVRSQEKFVVAGMGEKPEKCGVQRITHWNVGDGEAKILYGNLRCSRITCPSCYSHASIERVFNYSFLLESYARYIGERPAAVSASISPELSVEWTWDEFNTRLHRRGNRRLKAVGAIGGLRVFHPFRIKKKIIAELKLLGYGRNNENGGLWRGVREDALGLGDWRDYVSWGPHDHQIVFPSYLKENRNREFVLKKYAVLSGVGDVVAHIRYLLSHTAKVEGTGDKPTVMWGKFCGKRRWKPEEHLDKDTLDGIRTEIAGLLGMVYDKDTGVLSYPPDPLLENVSWKPVWELVGNMKNEDFCEVLSSSQYEFFYTMVSAMLNTPSMTGTEFDPTLLHEEFEPIRPDDVKPYYVVPPTEEDEFGVPCGDPEESEDLDNDFGRPISTPEDYEIKIVRHDLERIFFVCRRCGASHDVPEHPWVCDVARGGCGCLSDAGAEGTAFDPIKHTFDHDTRKWVSSWSFVSK